MNTFVMPEITMPFPPHDPAPGMDEMEADMWEWLDRFPLITDGSARHQLVRGGSQYWTARYYPNAQPGHLRKMNRCMAWHIIVDDIFDAAISANEEELVKVLSDSLVNVALGCKAPSSPVEHALVDFVRDLCVGRGESWAAAVQDAHVCWIRTFPVEAHAKRTGRAMEFSEYLRHRRDSVAQVTFAYLEEFANGLELLSAVRDLPALEQARNRACEWVGLYNDLYSAKKEKGVEYPYNSVLIIQAQRSCSIQEAADSVGDVLNSLLNQFQVSCTAATAQLRTIAGDNSKLTHDLTTVIEGYRHLIRGNYDCHIELPRYA